MFIMFALSHRLKVLWSIVVLDLVHVVDNVTRQDQVIVDFLPDNECSLPPSTVWALDSNVVVVDVFRADGFASLPSETSWPLSTSNSDRSPVCSSSQTVFSALAVW